MDPSSSSQDVLRCNLCDTPVPPLYCQLCDINLCKTCAGDHLLDDTKEHKVVPIKQKWNPTNPMCPNHTSKHCDLYCKHCGTPICALCVTSGEHDQHKKIDIFERKIETLEIELNELKLSIYHKYEKTALDITTKKDDLKNKSKQLKKIINEHGNVWHREIDNIIKNFLSKIDDNESRQMDIFEKEERNIHLRMKEISQNIQDLEKLVSSKDAHLAAEYTSRLSEFRQLPCLLNVFIPDFTAKNIDTKQLFDLFGNLSNCFFERELQNNSLQPTANKPQSRPRRSLRSAYLKH